MTTAIRPTTHKNWESFWTEQDYPEEDPIYGTINSLLYNIAMTERFGIENPDNLANDEVTLLALYRSWKDAKWFKRDPYHNKGDSFFTELGEMVALLGKISEAKPSTGHFIGFGSEGNNKAADRFLGVDDDD